jgi:hypothetical protein
LDIKDRFLVKRASTRAAALVASVFFGSVCNPESAVNGAPVTTRKQPPTDARRLSKSGSGLHLKSKEAHILTIQDPECRPFSPANMHWTNFSEAQKAEFEAAYQLERESKFNQAAKKYQELSSQISNFALLYNQALSEAASGDLTGAESSFKKSAQLNPQIRETFKMLSQVQQALGKTAESKASMHHYLSL